MLPGVALQSRTLVFGDVGNRHDKTSASARSDWQARRELDICRFSMHDIGIMGRKQSASPGPAHHFGGDWTAVKLDILRQYLAAYSTALSEKSFQTAYIDAFAGTGYRSLRTADSSGGLLFPDLAEDASQGLLEGSARMALRVEPRFHRYIFIEKDEARCQELEKLKHEFPEVGSSIAVRSGEANQVIRDLCRKNWSRHRAVLFLDPYGLQVEWDTVQSIAQTGAIDLWLLFPLGIGVNRLLPRSGRIPDGWRHRLNLFLGTSDWEKAFYTQQTTINLFGNEETTVVKATVEAIGQYFVDRLKTVFPGVAANPRVLMNSSNCPLYLFCFAVSSPNPRAREIALRIANHILKSD